MHQTYTDFGSAALVGCVGRVEKISGPTVVVRGLSHAAATGDRVRLYVPNLGVRYGQIISLNTENCIIFCDDHTGGIKIGTYVRHLPKMMLYPSSDWIGRVLDPFGSPLWGGRVAKGAKPYNPLGGPPKNRRGMGERLNTGFSIMNTVLPLVQGQRIGIFAGSGVGKSTFLGQLAQNIEADVIVISLIGERSREVRSFAEDILGTQGLEKAVIIAATSDMPATYRYQAALSAMTVAEYFRDLGKSVAYFADSITRFAEAYREISAHMGELPVLRGYPASLTHQITSLCERAGPGSNHQGDITAVFSVLVAGSDMDEPVADIIRGVLDGHIILDRTIAERGRFPAIDVTRSVSRALPDAASAAENDAIHQMRRLLARYEQSETMVRAGFYTAGQDAVLDDAIKAYPDLDKFIGQIETGTIEDSFKKLRLLLRKLRPAPTGAS